MMEQVTRVAIVEQDLEANVVGRDSVDLPARF